MNKKAKIAPAPEAGRTKMSAPWWPYPKNPGTKARRAWKKRRAAGRDG